MVHTHSSTASQRVHWVSQLLAHEGTYGVVSQMSQQSACLAANLVYLERERAARVGSGLRTKAAAGRVASPSTFNEQS